MHTRMRVQSIPAVARRTLIDGPFGAWNELLRWIAAHGHTPAPNLWEWCVVGPHLSPDPAPWRTERNRPVLSG